MYDPIDQIPLEPQSIRKVHVLSESLSFDPDIELNNLQLTDQDIVQSFESALTTRRTG